MSSIVCSVKGCHNSWVKRIQQLNQLCLEHRVRRVECCGASYRLHPPPKEEQHLNMWLQALNLEPQPTRPYVCSHHFVDGRPTDEHPYPEKWLGCDSASRTPEKVTRGPDSPVTDTSMGISVVQVKCEEDQVDLASYYSPVTDTSMGVSDVQVKCEEDQVDLASYYSPVTDTSMGVSDVQVKCEEDHVVLSTNCDVETQFVAPFISDHSYTTKTAPQMRLPSPDVGTQCRQPAALYITLLRTQRLCQLYTGLSLDVFDFLAEELTRVYNSSFQMHPWDQLLMTLIKLRLNLLQADLAARFGVSQSIVRKVISWWLDVLDDKMRCCIPWLPKETIQATMPQCFKEQFPKTTCVVYCLESPLKKPRNLVSEGWSFSHYHRQNAVKSLVSFAPCGLITFISPAYETMCSDEFIAKNSGFLEYLKEGDEVMADKDYGIKHLLYEKKVKLVIPASTESDMHLYQKDSTIHSREVLIHIKQLLSRLKTFKILSRVVPMNLTPKMDKILRICAALSNLRGDRISRG